MIKYLLLKIIGIYQRFVSPLIIPRCRYYPTCSTYGRQAILWHGVLRGGWLLIKRLVRCQPWGGSGVDFVPLPLYRYQYTAVKCIGLNTPWRDSCSYSSRLNAIF